MISNAHLQSTVHRSAAQHLQTDRGCLANGKPCPWSGLSADELWSRFLKGHDLATSRYPSDRVLDEERSKLDITVSNEALKPKHRLFLNVKWANSSCLCIFWQSSPFVLFFQPQSAGDGTLSIISWAQQRPVWGCPFDILDKYSLWYM